MHLNFFKCLFPWFSLTRSLLSLLVFLGLQPHLSAASRSVSLVSVPFLSLLICHGSSTWSQRRTVAVRPAASPCLVFCTVTQDRSLFPPICAAVSVILSGWRPPMAGPSRSPGHSPTWCVVETGFLWPVVEDGGWISVLGSSFLSGFQCWSVAVWLWVLVCGPTPGEVLVFTVCFTRGLSSVFENQSC